MSNEIEIPGFRVESFGSDMKVSAPLPEVDAAESGTDGVHSDSDKGAGGREENASAPVEIPGFRVESVGGEMKESVPLPEKESAAGESAGASKETFPASAPVEIPGFRVESREEGKNSTQEETGEGSETDSSTDGSPMPETDGSPEPEEMAENGAFERQEETVTRPEKAAAGEDASDQDRPGTTREGRRFRQNRDSSGRMESVETGIIPEDPSQVIGVRFHSAGRVYYFSPGSWKISRGMHVIVETARGTEYGTVAGNPLVVKKKQFSKPLKTIIRAATAEDDARNAENRRKEREAYRIAREKIAKHGLEMKLVTAEYTFDGSKVMFYFTADGRIDFRELVKDLASVLHTRIELRQIGVRDETRMLGGYGPCGRPLCCASYLNDFVPVSIRMAKEQNLSLNPGKISGVCGRLMCCLKNEEETYEDLNRSLPGIGDEVRGADGFVGEVENVNVLRQRIRILCEVNDEKELHEYGVGEFEILRKRRRGDRRHKLVDDRDAAGQNRGGRKPLSTVAAAVAARQKQEESERQYAAGIDQNGNADQGVTAGPETAALPDGNQELSSQVQQQSSSLKQRRVRAERTEQGSDGSRERRRGGRPDRAPRAYESRRRDNCQDRMNRAENNEDRGMEDRGASGENRRPEGRPDRGASGENRRPEGRPDRVPSGENRRPEGRPDRVPSGENRRPEGRPDRGPSGDNQKRSRRGHGRRRGPNGAGSETAAGMNREPWTRGETEADSPKPPQSTSPEE